MRCAICKKSIEEVNCGFSCSEKTDDLFTCDNCFRIMHGTYPDIHPDIPAELIELRDIQKISQHFCRDERMSENDSISNDPS